MTSINKDQMREVRHGNTLSIISWKMSALAISVSTSYDGTDTYHKKQYNHPNIYHSTLSATTEINQKIIVLRDPLLSFPNATMYA